jgi:hypothetical protein
MAEKSDVEQKRDQDGVRRKSSAPRRAHAAAAARRTGRAENARREGVGGEEGANADAVRRRSFARRTRARMEACSESVLLSIAVSNDKASSRPGISFARALFPSNPDVRVRRVML